MATNITTPFISLENIINNFIISYTGPGKLIPDSKRTEVVFHARRCLQEFSYETLKSQFSITETLLQAANSYAPIIITLPKDLVTIVDVHAKKRSTVDGDLGDAVELIEVGLPIDTFWNIPDDIYGHDYKEKTIKIPSTKYPGEVSITYLSNSLTTDEEAAIPKLAEEAMYACMVYAILANREGTNPNLLQRLLIEKIDKLERSKSRLVFTNFSE
jgi:hypothetical protein